MSAEPAAAPSPDGEPTTLFKASQEFKGAITSGRYRLLEEIGQGGMGTVWVAEQIEPVRRKVAIKFIKAGMDTKAVLARFEAEQQALAMMDHPNIAKVHDGGRTDDGRPFFVMEYVKGVPITDYCDLARLSVQQRLALMVPVCQAVQHAHQKGIIHRDLKPSNILVCLYDGQPVPKVIDFGLAKAIHQPLTERTLYTAQGVMIGTPLYMSPEQAELGNLDIDTRTDIYSLGVILYELLTGTTPFDRQQFRKAAWQEVLRLIKEEEPPKPSTRISSLSSVSSAHASGGQSPPNPSSLTSIAAVRQAEPARLSRLVRGELDWIAMKCLEKERSRRYDTANGLALDLQRYLGGEPVHAAPPSAIYRVRKTIRRHKGLVAAAALVLLALLIGIAGTTSGMIQARTERIRAEANEDKANANENKAVGFAQELQQALIEAEKQKQIAQIAAKAEKAAGEQTKLRLEEIVKLNKILASIFMDLDLDKIEQSDERLELVLGRRLKEAAGQLRGEAIGDPLLMADLQNTLAMSLLSLGDTSEVIALLEESSRTHERLLGQDHPETLQVTNNLAVAYTQAAQYERAAALLEKGLATRKEKLGPTHPDTLNGMNDLALVYAHLGQLDAALNLAKETLALRKEHLGPDHKDTITTMNALAMIHHEVGEDDLALRGYEEVLVLAKAKFGPDHPYTLTTMSNLALAYQRAGNLTSAVTLCEQTLALRKAKLGANHRDTHVSMNNLAMAYRAVGKQDLALPLYEETLALTKADLGENHPSTFTSMNNLARAYQAAGKLDLAIPLYDKTLALRKAKLGPTHPSTLSSMNNLANAYCDVGKFDLAAPLCKQTLELQREALGPDHPDVLISMNLLAGIHLNAGRLDQAVPLLEETLNLRKAKLGEEHPYTLTSMNNLASAYQQIEKREEAVKLLEQVDAIRRRTLDADHPEVLGGMNNLAGAYQDAGRLDLALPLFEQVLAARNAKLDSDHPDRLISLNNLAAAKQLAGKPDEAAALFTEAFALRKAKLGQDHPDTVSSMINLASAWHDAGNSSQFQQVIQEALILFERRGFDNLAPGTIQHATRLFEVARLFDKAETLRRAWLAIVKEQTGADSPQTAGELSALGLNLLRQEKWTEAEASLRECLAIREKAEADAWTTFNARSALGEALLGQKKYAEAEPLLVQGYQGVKQREEKIPAVVKVTRLREAIQRLVQLYEAMERPDDVARWKRELEGLAVPGDSEESPD